MAHASTPPPDKQNFGKPSHSWQRGVRLHPKPHHWETPLATPLILAGRQRRKLNLSQRVLVRWRRMWGNATGCSDAPRPRPECAQ